MSKLGLSLPTKTVLLCTNLTLAAEHEKASFDLARVQQENTTNDQRENSPEGPLVAKIRELEEEMHKHTLTFTLSALPKKVFAEIEAKHPPREGNEEDKTYGMNMSTGVDALLSHTLPATIVSVVDAEGEKVDFTGSDWNEAADEMSNAQWTLFMVSVLALNRATSTVPFSRAASRATRRSEQS